MDAKIVFEDDSMIVINKPAGVVVNRADTTGKIETIQDFLDLKFKVQDFKFEDQTEVQAEFLSRSGIVHRLDKDTSGVLVIAKNPEAFENLKNQFKERKTVKKYLALVHGKVEPRVGKIDAPIERSPFNRMHFGVFPGGREAQTDYKLIELFEKTEQIKGKKRTEHFSLLEVTPHTGRTHQIRVHMKHLGHAIVSDPIYGGRKQIRDDLKWCPRLFLHAASLEVSHPASGKKMVFEADLPSDLENLFAKLAGNE